MADAMVERRPPPTRFFCHKCNVEFEEALQDYTCPYCSGGFIEQIDADSEVPHSVSGDETSDVEMTSLDSSDDQQESTGSNPSLGDLAFLMSGRRLRGVFGGAENMLRDMMVSMTAGRSGTPVFLLTGSGGHDVVSEVGLDAVVTQLLGQLEGSGPPPLPTARVENLPTVEITEEQIASRLQCSICWEPYQSGETVRQLECKHVFHEPCIVPWLNLHATCPICRHCLLSDDEVNNSGTNLEAPILQTISSLVVHAFPRIGADAGGGATPGSSTTSASVPPRTASTQSSTTAEAAADKMAKYNCDLDYD